MAVRRTREEKIQIQQRREVEKFSWKNSPQSSASPKVSLQKPPTHSQETEWSKQDLWQTLLAAVVILLLLGFLIWQGR